MDLMETKSMIKERQKSLSVKFSGLFEEQKINGKTCFKLSDGRLFAIDGIAEFGAMVIEYAEDFEEAKMNQFEDGDLFYLEEMDEETMFQNMLQEIGQ